MYGSLLNYVFTEKADEKAQSMKQTNPRETPIASKKTAHPVREH